MTKTQTRMRIYHRYLGYFLAGIMAVYAISGTVLIFRTTDFLKQKKHYEKQITAHLKPEDVGKEIKLRELKVLKEDSTSFTFKQGSYNKLTGEVKYDTKELPFVINKLTELHKANTKSPLFFLNVFFALSLLFFVVSAFWMFMPKTKIFKKGLYFTLAGIILTLVMLFL